MATPMMANKLITGANMIAWNLWHCGGGALRHGRHGRQDPRAHPAPPSPAAAAGKAGNTPASTCKSSQELEHGERKKQVRICQVQDSDGPRKRELTWTRKVRPRKSHYLPASRPCGGAVCAGVRTRRDSAHSATACSSQEVSRQLSPRKKVRSKKGRPRARLRGGAGASATSPRAADSPFCGTPPPPLSRGFHGTGHSRLRALEGLFASLPESPSLRWPSPSTQARPPALPPPLTPLLSALLQGAENGPFCSGDKGFASCLSGNKRGVNWSFLQSG